MQGDDKENVNEVTDHVVVEAVEFGILGRRTMLLNHLGCLPKQQPNRNMSNCKVESQRVLDRH
jgi:hypothetical protein